MQLIIPLYLSTLLTSLVIADKYPKRQPYGFTAVRGKKSDSDYLYNSDDLMENEVQNFPSNTRNFLPPSPDGTREPQDGMPVVEAPLSGDSDPTFWTKNRPSSVLGNDIPVGIRDMDDSMLVKRSPYGFVGVRGKKLSPLYWQNIAPELYEKIGPDLSLRKQKEAAFYQYDQKKSPYTFLGMRGKKQKYVNFKSQDKYGDKRAPMGFIGMRGKKSYNGWNEEDITD